MVPTIDFLGVYRFELIFLESRKIAILVKSVQIAAYKDLPVFSSVSSKEVLEGYMRVKKDVAMIVQTEIERMLNTPEL